MRYGKGYKRYYRTGCQVVISLELLGQETKYSTHLDIKLSDGAEFEEDEENITTGCLFPREPVNFVRRKCSNSQEIFRNMKQNVELFESFYVENTI